MKIKMDVEKLSNNEQEYRSKQIDDCEKREGSDQNWATPFDSIENYEVKQIDLFLCYIHNNAL